MPYIPNFERVGLKFELYERDVEDFRLGPYHARLCKEHLVGSSEGRSGITYYSHYYNSRSGIKLAPYQPAIESKQKKDDIDLRSLDHNCLISISEAEALVAKYPNRSEAWEYGAFSYFLYDSLHKAKLFLRRGINTIDSREHKKKLILWKALILIEAGSGSKEDLLAIFEEALKNNNKKMLCLQTLFSLIKAKKTEAFVIIKDRILKKFKSEREVYIILGEYYMKLGAKEEVKDLLERGLKYVPPKEHPYLLKKFAILEHEYAA